MCFASLYVPSSGNQGDLTAVEKDWYRSSSRSRSIARCRFAPSILADIGKMLCKIWFKDTKKAVTADTMESLLSKGKFVLNINLHYIYSTCL